jgi:ribose 5-phosphate isomerase
VIGIGSGSTIVYAVERLGKWDDRFFSKMNDKNKIENFSRKSAKRELGHHLYSYFISGKLF